MRKALFFLLLLAQVGLCQQLRKPGDNHSIPVVAGTGQPDADLEKIRSQVIADLLAPDVHANEVKTLIQSQKPDGTWPGINYTDVSRTGFEHSQHLNNLLALARAFKKPGSAYSGHAETKRAFALALDYWLAHDFICDNWWWNEMGTPNLMVNILLVMDEDLTEKQRTEGVRIAGRANMEASGARPGGDLIQIAGMRGRQALLQRNSQELASVIDVMASEIKVSTGRGLKPDLSFHHRTDNVISTLAYGTGYANAFAYWAVKTAETRYHLPDPQMKMLVDYFLDGICQSHIYGKYPDPGAENRGISRKGALKPAGPELAENLLASTSYRKQELEDVIRIRKNEAKANRTRDHYFWHSHYYTHQRPNHFVSVRMHSKRAANMEQPHNEEGLKNHHYGDGSQFISITGKEFDQIFPVFDWQKIPGTTVVQKADVAHWKELAKQGKNDFTGGVTDQRYGAAAFDFESVHDPLKAKKAWFFFDLEVVNLGAGISSESERTVATTLNQCLLSGNVTTGSKRNMTVLKTGEHQLNAIEWVQHGGVAYIFPEPARIHLTNQQQTGSWRQINHHSWATEEVVKHDVFKLWLDHGVKPGGGAYQYIVVPNLEPTDIENYRKQDNIQILSNTTEIQAVRHKGLGITQIVFYKPGKLAIPGSVTVTSENAGLVMVKTKGKTVSEITVADPTHQLSTFDVEINTKIRSTAPATQSRSKDGTLLTIKLPSEGMAGQSVNLPIR
ncbi:MAG TPA: polysaccharide lyase family 8 super-sandwich domain-containing protein [Dyadobacter sp.]|nr:polysaccharide lyase family 8 super-sandwich domain-containing protein [Dyadobacter sp.]